jgi:hypothetical protein
MTDLPITPEKILRALEGKRSNEIAALVTGATSAVKAG